MRSGYNKLHKTTLRRNLHVLQLLDQSFIRVFCEFYGGFKEQ